MMIVMESTGFRVNMPIGFKVLLISIALIWCILLFLYYRLNHFRKRVHFTIDNTGAMDMLSSGDWEKQMRELSTNHKYVKSMRYNFVLEDYNQIAYRKLNRIRKCISEISTDIIALIPAAQWLFDNFQMMYREIKKVRSSGTSYEVLPILRKEYRGFPRVYIIAKKMVTLSQGHLNEENISIMLNAYQAEVPLTDKELWVLPEMLGFCLLESIIDEAEDIIRIINIKSKADRFVRERLDTEQERADISVLLSGLDEESKQSFSFHAHVIYLLKNMSFDEVSIQKYIEHYFKIQGKMIKPSNLFLEEGKIESLHEAKIRALIISLREINELDGEKFFEVFSYLEQILSRDPDGVYTKMDSEGRSMYREVIVKTSLKYKINEEKIANDCLELAIAGREDIYCSHHVGAYLLGKGFPILEAKIRNKPIPTVINKKGNVKGRLYFLTFGLLFLIINCLIGCIMYFNDRSLESYHYIIILLAAFPLLIGIGLEITNFIFTRRIRVTKIPSLNYLMEIPDSSRTFVVMPVIVSSKEQGLEYFDRLHKHYLANRQSNLYFALLVDYEDAPNQVMPKDEVIEQALMERMKELNELYPSAHQKFSLLTRYRKWNKSENCYMGWERKRGKIEEFNQLLNGAEIKSTSFLKVLCDTELLGTFKYVITLDADTNLIRDNAAKLVGLISHPLNQPVLDTKKRRVKEGYVIIQPSVRNHIVDKSGSRFTEIFGGESGLAHYSAVISDIYQDIFNEGIYIGKGIYDVKAFHQLLHNTIPENRVLSHDLLESCYARTAFSSTAKIMDNFPSSVLSFVKREHRWIRGDWQLFPWLFKGKDSSGRALSPVSRWKIFDNLRRSMVPLSKILIIITTLAILPGVSYLWIGMVFFTDVFNLIIQVVAVIGQKIFRSKLALVYKGLFREFGVLLQRAFIEFVITPYRAYMATDAMIRTLYRLYISKKNLLRWNTAEIVDSSVINTTKGYFLSMWSSLIPSVIILGLLLIREVHPIEFVLYIAVALVWILAFRIAYHVSQPKEKVLHREIEEDREFLLETARRTWQFFKDFGVKEKNWLCPDNYQLARVEKVSDKTSPTNIGLQFLSILSARDFGFETLSATIKYVENLLETVLELPKWKGHLYNWYSVKTLEVLNPAYISTVDSGNFIGHLIALKNGLREQINQPVFSEHLFQEIGNLITLSNSSFSEDDASLYSMHELKEEYKTIGDFIEDITDIWEELNSRELTLQEASRWSKELENDIELIVNEASDYKLKEYGIMACPTLKQLSQKDNKNAVAMIDRIEVLCCKIDCLLENVDFRFLFDEKRMLFHIGYHVPSHTIDAGCYDLMASEASLLSFLAISRGEAPLRHWYKLGRPLTMVKGIPCFVSWSGTMFEYLMPNLVLREYEGSVYAETSKAAILQHMNYAKEAGIPWGISESQFYRFDINANYQYKAFGVPKLRLQPVRRNSLVATPYATMLALDYTPEECMSNLRRLMELGVYGDYGFYEAIDYNSPDSVELTPYCVVRSFMAHHQGMIMVAINNHLNQGIMRRRFHEEPIIKATEVLLEEKRQSHLISLAKRGYTIKIGKVLFKEHIYCNRYVNSVAPKIPIANYLSNNKYSLMITSDGDGFSSFKNMMLYRWRADLYANTGNYIYIKDMNKDKLWSATYHPVRKEPEEYQVIFSPHQAEFKREDEGIKSHTSVSLSPDYNLEIRKLKLTNNGIEDKILEITSYFEVVGDLHIAELSHPAFNKLFIESEFLEEQSVFLSKRRGSKSAGSPYIMHMAKTNYPLLKKLEYENDRLKFIGRNNTLENPQAVVNSLPLSNRAGFCNDPIMSLRVTISLKAGETACISFITGVCKNKEEAIKISDELSIAYRIDDIFEKFRLQTDIELKYLDITRPQLNAFQDLISPIFYPSSFYRGPQEYIRKNNINQSFLWKFGVSGDYPIMLLKVKTLEDEGILRDALKAYEYLRINRLMVDLIILSDAKHGYLQELDNLVNDLTSSLRIYESDNEKQSLFMLHSYQMNPSEIDLLYTVARVVFSEQTGIYFTDVKENMNDIIEE